MDNQVPTLQVRPPWDSTRGHQVDQLAKVIKVTLDPWQSHLTSVWCAVKDDMWASSVAAACLSRQQGKSMLLMMRILAGALLFDEEVIMYSAHRSDLVRHFFNKFHSFIEENPVLKKRVVKVFSSSGREFVDMRRADGGVCRVLFSVRTPAFARGLSINTLIIDEAQDLSPEMMESMLPALAAVHNAQMIMVGTVPGPDGEGEVFTRYHDLAKAGTSADLAWSEWSAEPGCDLDDPEVWKRVNPAYGIRITEKTIRAEREASSDAGFLRERLSVWENASSVEVIPSNVWKRQELEVTDPQAEILTDLSVGIDTSGDRSRTSVTVAGKNISGDYVISLVEQFSNPDMAVKFTRDLAKKNTLRAVVVDARSQAGTLIDKFKREGIRPMVTTDRDMATACGNLFDGITDGWLWHIGQVQLTTALQQARKRPIGDAWGWNRKSAVSDITPLVGVSLALFGAMTSKPKKPLRGGSDTGSSQRMIVLQ